MRTVNKFKFLKSLLFISIFLSVSWGSSEVYTQIHTHLACYYRGTVVGQSIDLQAKLTDESGSPIAGRSVWMSFQKHEGNYTTDSSGIARKWVTVWEAGDYSYAAEFNGDDTYWNNWEGIVVGSLRVNPPPKLDTTLNGFYQGVLEVGRVITLYARLTQKNTDNRIPGKTIEFGIEHPYNFSGTGTTDSNGLASVNVGLTHAGTVTCSAHLAGDSEYNESWDHWDITINPYTPSPAKPEPPSNLSATAVSSSQINLSWQDKSNNEDGFKIYRDGSYLTSVGANITSYSDKGLADNTAYSYRVRAYNSAGESADSNTANATTSPTGQPPPPPPPTDDVNPPETIIWIKENY